jgi:hypothetical protein
MNAIRLWTTYLPPSSWPQLAFFLISLCALGVGGCKNGEPADAPAYSLPAHEEKDLYPIVCGDYLVLTSECDSASCLRFVPLSSDKQAWYWLDTQGAIARLYYNLTPYCSGKLLAIPFPASLKIFDLEAQVLLHDLPLPGRNEPHMQGYGQIAYITAYADDACAANVLAIDLLSGLVDTLQQFHCSRGSTFICQSPIAWQQGDGRKGFVLGSLVYEPQVSTASRLLAWSEGDTAFQIERVYPDNPFGFGISKPPLTDVTGKRSFWVAKDRVFCFDHERWEVSWSNDLGHSAITSSLQWAGGDLVFPAENLHFYRLDPATGAVLDTIADMPGTPSRLFAAEGCLWFVGGSDGYLYRLPLAPASRPERFKLKNHEVAVGHYLRRVMWADETHLIINNGSHWLVMGSLASLPAFLAPAP